MRILELPHFDTEAMFNILNGGQRILEVMRSLHDRAGHIDSRNHVHSAFVLYRARLEHERHVVGFEPSEVSLKLVEHLKVVALHKGAQEHRRS